MQDAPGSHSPSLSLAAGRTPITSVTAWTLLVPVVGVVLGVVVFGERVTLIEAIGDAIVVIALALVAYATRHRGGPSLIRPQEE